MIELRQRINSSSYQKLSVEEVEEEPDKVTKQRTITPFTYFTSSYTKRESNTCKASIINSVSDYFLTLDLMMCILNIGLWVLVCLSFSGMLFLSFIAHQLENNSIYLKVGKINENRKPELAAGVEGAIFLYLLTAICALWCIYKPRTPDSFDTSYRDPHLT